MQRNCPNCGAPSEGQFCRYCDTPLFDTVDAVKNAIGKRCHVWYEDCGHVYGFDVMLHEITNDCYPEPMAFASNDLYITIPNNRKVKMSGSLKDISYDDWKEFLEWRNHEMR